MKKSQKHTKKPSQREENKAARGVPVADAFTGTHAVPETNEENSEARRIFSSLLASVGASIPSEPSVALRVLLKGLLFGVLSFLFGRTPLLLDTYPLGIALLCSAERYLPYIFVGAVLSAFTAVAEEGVIFSPYIYLAAYFFVMLIRATTRIFIDRPDGLCVKSLFRRGGDAEEKTEQLKLLVSSLFGENVYLRMATACVSAFLVSIYALNTGEYRFYDLFSAMFAMVSAPAVTFIFSGLYNDSGVFRPVAEIGILSAAVFALRGTYLLGINAGAFIAFGASVLLARKKGILYASVASLISGLAFSPIYAPSFVLSSICSGVITGSVFSAVACSTALSVLWGAYIDGFGVVTAFMPAIISSSVFVCAADSFIALPQREREHSVGDTETSVLSEKERAENAEERFMRLGETFKELSTNLYKVSDRLRSPGMSETRSVCLHAFESRCAKCPREDDCKGEYSSFSESVSKMSEILAHDGRVRLEALPPYVTERCINIAEVAEEATHRFAELVRAKITGEKTELFALDYEAVSHIIAEALESSRSENLLDIELSERLTRELGRSGLGMTGITVHGERKKRIYCRNIGKKAEGMGVNELQRALEEAAGFPLSEPVFELRDGKVALRIESAPVLGAESGIAVKSAKGESVCGDSATVFHGRDGKFYALVSDGMGSGGSASVTSEICSSFLRTMLVGGNKKETSLKMLNAILRSKSEECSATVDLMEIDLIGGSASFLKSGAAPSFVRRGEKLYKLRSGTAPIGIMRGVDAEQVRFELSDGDIIVMLSDGMGQCPEESVWLMDMLGGEWDEDEPLEAVAERIAETAEKEGGGDDISVVLVRVKERR
ncbi:MAG: hypothetical protein E7671_00850 [Ruminococcaceae bacterium]|nr:hypothetical protein [Oscillospiraceae bacterium]